MARPAPSLRRTLTLAARVGLVTAACVAYSLVAQVRPSSIPDRDVPGDLAAGVRVLGEAVERAAVEPAPAPAPTSTPATVLTTTSLPTTVTPTTVTPTTIPPTTVTPATVPAPPTDLQLLRERILASISFPWATRLPGWSIEFHPPREGFRGSTRPKERTIRIYERRGSSFEDYRHVTLHEIGHAVDVTLLDAADRHRWQRTRGRDPRAAWWVTSGADDFASGAGDWAESFARWQGADDAFHSTIGGVPDQRQLDVLADIVG